MNTTNQEAVTSIVECEVCGQSYERVVCSCNVVSSDHYHGHCAAHGDGDCCNSSSRKDDFHSDL